MSRNQLILKKTINISSIIGIILTALCLIYGYKIGIFTSMDQLSATISKVGIWGPILFILIQIVQVVVPIIPGGISCVAGVVIFGPVYGFIYNYLGILIGSIINFALARYYGKSFIQAMVSDTTYEKYAGWLDKGKRFDKLFAVAIFMPVAPDDFLCMLAGLTKMSYRRFIAIIALGKPASLLAYSMGLTAALNAFMNTLS